MAPHCLGKPGDAGPRGTDNRLFVEAVLWIVRTGSPWRDLPEEFGKCNTVFKRFRDWVKADIWQKLFDAVSGQPDMQYAMVDAEAPVTARVDLAGSPQLGAIELRPGQGREVQLGVGRLPYEEVVCALLAVGADQQVHVAHGG